MTNILDFDSREFEKRMKIYGDMAQATILRIMTSNAMDLEDKAKATAPYDEGTLEGDIMATKAERKPDEYVAYVYAGTGESRPYALRQHEELRPAPQMKMKPRARTFMKPLLPWGMAGGKYLTRPLMFMMNEYQARIAKALDALK